MLNFNMAGVALPRSLAFIFYVGILGISCSPHGHRTTRQESLVTYRLGTIETAGVNGKETAAGDFPVYQQLTKVQKESKSAVKHPASFAVSIDTDTAIHKVDPRFLSTGISVHRVAKETTQSSLPLNSTLIRTLANGLSPAVFRVGGKRSDETVFLPEGSGNAALHRRYHGNNSILNHVMTGASWKKLNEFTLRTGLDIAYGLNLVYPRNGKAWDPTNAKQLLDFNADLGYRVIWELGNEPQLFKKNYGIKINAKQLAKDFMTLRKILNNPRYERSNTLVGPDTNHLPIYDLLRLAAHNGTAYLERFLKRAGDAINATSIHFYNIHKDSDTSIVNFTDPDVLDRMVIELDRFSKVVRETKPVGSRERWIGESSVCSGGGLKPESHRYIAGFSLLSNLGIAAKKEISIYVYWSFYGNNYSLVSYTNQQPRVIYWVALLHKRLVGKHVLSVSYSATTSYDSTDKSPTLNPTRYVRVFAHCTAASSSYPAGAVTLIALNMLNESHAHLHLTSHMTNNTVDEYRLTPQGGQLDAKRIRLNGQLLKMVNDTTFPDLTPRPLPVASVITLPPMTYGFYVIKDANATACLDE